MNQSTLPDNLLGDVFKFILIYYREHLPHSLLIAQKFCLKHQEHGKKFSLSTITEAAEHVMKRDIF